MNLHLLKVEGTSARASGGMILARIGLPQSSTEIHRAPAGRKHGARAWNNGSLQSALLKDFVLCIFCYLLAPTPVFISIAFFDGKIDTFVYLL